jgi:hypothetical protein
MNSLRPNQLLFPLSNLYSVGVEECRRRFKLFQQKTPLQNWKGVVHGIIEPGDESLN